MTRLRLNRRSYCGVRNPNERLEPIYDNLHRRKKGVRSGFAEGPIPVVPVNPVLYYYYYSIFLFFIACRSRDIERLSN